VRDANDREFADRRGDLDVESIGPFERFPLVVNGWTVPHLEAQNKRDGGVYVSLDNRFGLDLPDELAGPVLSFMANVVAVAMGYPCHPRRGEEPPQSSPPWHRLSPLPMLDPRGAGDA
jgi:hypothetical protein